MNLKHKQCDCDSVAAMYRICAKVYVCNKYPLKLCHNTTEDGFICWITESFKKLFKLIVIKVNQSTILFKVTTKVNDSINYNSTPQG